MSYIDLFDDEYDMYDDFSSFEDEYENAVGSDEEREAKSLLANTGDIPYQITVTNTSAGTLNLILFGSNQYLLAPNFGSATGLVVTPSQSNVSYLQLLQQSAIKPFKTKLSRVQSSNPNQVTQVMTITVTDADGNSCLTPLVTQEYFSAYQSQRGLLDVPYEFSIDEQTSISTQVLANTTVTYTFYPYLLDEKTDKKEEDKTLKKVQFTITNNTLNPLPVNLFNTDTLIPQNTTNSFTTPTSVSSSNTVAGFSSGITSTPDGSYYVSKNGLGRIDVYDSSNIFVTSIVTGGQPAYSDYNAINNFLYVCNFSSGQIFIIDCATNTLINTISGFATGTRYVKICSLTNQLYVATADITIPLQILDCATNSIITPSFPYNTLYRSIAYNINQNLMYVSSQTTTEVQIVDCDTNTYVGAISLSSTPLGIVYCPTNNCIYVTYFTNNLVTVISCLTNTVVTSFNLPNIASWIIQPIYVAQFNMLYFSDAENGFIYEVDPTINSVISNLTVPVSAGAGIFASGTINFNLNNTTLYSVITQGANAVISGLGGTVIPYYVSSSADYNFFIQSLETNPMVLEQIKFVAPQNQLKNVINVQRTDANGYSASKPYFPINDLSTDQRQGNIAYVDFKGMILDGKTFFNNYYIEPLQSLTMVLTYKQSKVKCPEIINSFLKNSKRLKSKQENDFDLLDLV